MKKQLKIYKLHFTSPLHIGDVRDDYSVSLKTIESDTMYAALISCLAKMGETIPLNGDLGCTISSLFPFYQKDKDSEPVLFFPKPLKQNLPTSEKSMEERKKIKKVTWLDSDNFSKILKGDNLFDDDTIEKGIQGVYLTKSNIDKDFILSQVSQRVTVSRDGKENAVPFYMDRLMFKGYSGLYFIADGDTSLLNKAMNLLQHEGIGTDRNVGNGYFEYEEKNDVFIELSDDEEFVMSLSTFIPESKEQMFSMLNSESVAYDFQRRGGWITSPPHNTLRKNAIYAFTPSSVFKYHSKGLEKLGKVDIDLKPQWDSNLNHPIWRCGRSLFIPIKIN